MKIEQPIIVADANIPFLKGVLDEKAVVRYLPAAEITNEQVRDADALIVRTRTRCNESLLENTNVKFVVTATIGFDHIDTEYCRLKNIKWQNAQGCNADSVGQYVASALCFWASKYKKNLSELTLGIVGWGSVGQSVERYAKLLGMNVLRNDPPRQQIYKNESYVSLETITSVADIITFHTPLITEGIFATYHLADNCFFNNLKRKPLLINSARGGVVDEQALLEAMDLGKISDCIIDCWENEPNINPVLLERSLLATPHIAGYSADGKANATQICVRALSCFFELGLNDFVVELPEKKKLDKNVALQEQLLFAYPIERDSNLLKKSLITFEQQRSNYPMRRECDIK